MNLKDYLNEIIIRALEEFNYDASSTLVSVSNRPDLSDYQSNIAMPLAKFVKKSPREIACEIKEFLEKDPSFSKVTVDGPGFINVSFSDDRLLNIDIAPKQFKGKVVLDYGGPNIAKEMHIPKSCILSLMRKNRIKRKDFPRKSKYKITIQELKNLFSKGYSNQEIAIKYQIPNTYVARRKYQIKKGEI